MDHPMECKQFEKLIPDFIDGKLDFLTLSRFKDHYDACKDCKEELVIQFLVKEGMVRLEEGSAFDLQKELNKLMQEAQARINWNNSILSLGAILEIISMTAIGIGVMWIILN